jgi:hypothetical protein
LDDSSTYSGIRLRDCRSLAPQWGHFGDAARAIALTRLGQQIMSQFDAVGIAIARSAASDRGSCVRARPLVMPLRSDRERSREGRDQTTWRRATIIEAVGECDRKAAHRARP